MQGIILITKDNYLSISNDTHTHKGMSLMSYNPVSQTDENISCFGWQPARTTHTVKLCKTPRRWSVLFKAYIYKFSLSRRFMSTEMWFSVNGRAIHDVSNAIMPSNLKPSRPKSSSSYIKCTRLHIYILFCLFNKQLTTNVESCYLLTLYAQYSSFSPWFKTTKHEGRSYKKNFSFRV